MQCPVCKTEMEKGLINGYYWLSGDKPTLSSMWWPGRKGIYTTAWRCPQDGKIELSSEV